MGVIRLYICIMLKNLVCFLLLTGLALGTYAQDKVVLVEKSKKTKKIDGKQYYIHTVEKGQTLYSIGKVYDVLISQIVFDNPEAIDGIKPDMVLKIEKQDPRKANNKTEEPMGVDGNYVIYIVKPQETLYSLSKRYDVSMVELSEANKDVLADGLQIGDTLRIPISKIDADVPKSEPIKITEQLPLPLDTVQKKKGSKDMYSVAYLLPLFLNDTSSADELNPNKPEKIRDEALNGIEFFQGVKLALDSLQKNGMRANIYAYDTEGESSETKVRTILSKPEVKNADLIIGPFYQNLFTLAQKYSEAYQVPIVSPVSHNSSLISANRFSGKITVPEQAEVTEISKFVSSTYCRNNVLVVHKGKEDEMKRVAWFKNAYKCDSLHSFKEINYKYATWDSLARSLSRVDTNIIVVLSEDQAFVTSFFITLDKRKDDYPMTVFGVGTWADFENIETDYYHDLRLHLPITNNIDYDNPVVVNFVKKYREAYQNEPTYFSFLGFDMTYYFLSAMNRMGTEYFDMLQFYRWQGLQTGFSFKRNSANAGLENQSVYIVQYKEFQQKKVN